MELKQIMDGAGVSAAGIKSLLQNLIKDENHTIRGEDAGYPQTTLQTIQGYLNDAEKKLTTEEDVEIWMRMLEAVAIEAKDVFDERSNPPLPNRMRRTPMDKVLSCFNHIARRNMALKIKQISSDFESMNRKANEIGLINVNAPVPASASTAYYETDLLTFDPVFAENDLNVLNLVDEMLRPQLEPKEISVFAIVGIRGSGKTTLAMRVCNHEKMNTRFDLRIRVNVSQNFDPKILEYKILSALTSQTTDGVESREVILKRLQQALKHKTYLLVLDDVWYEDFSKWESFMHSMMGVTSTRGNAIIITTRIPLYVSMVMPVYIHFIADLSYEAVWSIIKKKAFEDREVPSEFEMVVRDIARKCVRLPLAAHVVGAMLRDKSIEYWQSYKQTELGDDEAYDVGNILKLRYDNLTLERRKCLVCCSIFPKGAEIRKQELLELWMAGGFLETSDEMESAGDMVFNVLLEQSLLLPVEIDDYGNVKRCTIHGLVHDLASRVLDSLITVRYKSNGILFSWGEEADEAKHLNAFYLKSKGKISGTMFSEFECLHVLTLYNYRLKALPRSIRKLTSLKYLNISRTRIETLPVWIHKLCHLQTLNAATESLRELPEKFKYLISLWYLYIPSHVKMPESGRFINLRVLKFSVSEQKGYRIEELGSLKNLRELSIDNLEKVQNEKEVEKANLDQKPSLTDLQLEWDVADRKGLSTNDENVLKGLEPSSGLEKLKIKGFRGKAFPPWIQSMDKLTNITLSHCHRCEKIPKLGHLPNLKSLHFWTLCNVKEIDSSFYGSSDNRVIFPALETMLLSDMPELLDWEKGKFLDAPGQPEAKVLPRLRFLKIYHCKKLEFLPSWIFSQARNLSEIDIRHCPKLTELPDGLDALNSLKSITIKCCQNLKSIIGNSSSRGELASLVSLEIRDCQGLMAMVESLKAPYLKKVSMVELRSLENLPRFIDCLSESPNLQELKITGVPNFMSIDTSSVERSPFHRLRKLEIDVSEATMKMVVDGWLTQCRSSLKVLILRGLEIWKSLPNSIEIGDLTALYSLELENFGGQELPEGLGKLSSLTRLSLSNCLKLRCLPSLLRLKELEALYICNCPELRIESERRKILRCTLTYVNGHLI